MHKINARTALCFILLAPLTVLALPKADDVVGIRLGMTQSEAKSALKQYQPNMRIGASADSMQGCSQPGCDERIDVYFGQVTGKAYRIERFVNTKFQVLTDQIRAGILEKYGQPVSKTGYTMAWTYDSKNSPLTDRDALGECEPVTVNGAPNKGTCGQALRAEILGDPGQRASNFSVKLIDYQLRYEDAVAQRSRNAAAETARNKGLAGNVPKF